MQVLSTSFIKLETYVHRKSIRVTKIQNSADVSIFSYVYLHTHTHTHHNLFINSSVDRHLGHFHIWLLWIMMLWMRKCRHRFKIVIPCLYICTQKLNCWITWFSSVQFNHSVMSDSATPWTAACQAFLSIANSQSLLKVMSIKSVMPSKCLILSCPLQSFPASASFPKIQFFT